MTKYDITIEPVDSGYIVEMDGRKFTFRTDITAVRTILKYVRGGGLPFTHAEQMERMHFGLDRYHAVVIGVLQKRVLETIEAHGKGTIESIALALWPEYGKKMEWFSTFRAQVRYSITGLMHKGYICKTNRNSRWYRLTDKRPSAYIVKNGNLDSEPAVTDVPSEHKPVTTVLVRRKRKGCRVWST